MSRWSGEVTVAMSAMGQKQTFTGADAMSASCQTQTSRSVRIYEIQVG